MFNKKKPSRLETKNQSDTTNNFMPVNPPDGGAKTYDTKPKNPIIKFWSKQTKKQKFFIITCVVLIVALGFAIVFIVTKKEPQPVSHTEPPITAEAPKTTEPSRLTGLEVPAEYNQRTATGMMIENSPDARPQSGLKDAGVVYEAVVEGGITRFMAVFQDALPEYAGPVRSARPYFLDFITPYDAGLAHVGGSPQALAELKDQNLKDLDQFAGQNSSAYWRESSRYAPHNMYTNVVKLKEIEKQKGWTSKYEGFVRGGEDKPSATPNAKTINIKMSSRNYAVAYSYDAATNSYLRSEGGKPHMDAKSNTQLSPKVLVVPIINRTQNGIYSVYAVNGSGKVLVFQNGTITEGTWQKTDRKSQFKFTGTDGQPLKLAPGQTWVTIAASAGDVTFAP